MKKLCLLMFFLSVVSTTIVAQEHYGSFKEIAQEGKAKIVVDYSEAMIHGMNEEEFAVYEPDWMKDKPVVIGKFLTNFSEELDGMLVCHGKAVSPFTVLVKMLSINVKGNTVLSIHILKGDIEMAAIKGIKEDGGTFGTKLNLIKDGAAHVGEKAGASLKKVLKKALKSK